MSNATTTDTAPPQTPDISAGRPAEHPPIGEQRSVNAAPSADGKLEVRLGDVVVHVDACRLTRETTTLSHCTGDTHIRIDRAGESTHVMVTSLYLDSESTLYRGPLDPGAAQKAHSLTLTDVDGDGREDLIVWTGREGAYGGPSFDVLLSDASSAEFYAAPAFSELTVGANGLFSIDKGDLKLSSTDGCCTRYFDTYAVEANEPKLIERVTEKWTEGSDSVSRKVERLVGEQMQEVN